MNPAMGFLAKFFDLFWGWADYKLKNWSNAPYKRGYAPEIPAVDQPNRDRVSTNRENNRSC
jgi:hypothetical protein